MSNTYELAVLIHSDLENDLDKATAKIQKLVKDLDGKITAEDNWGKRKLAYKINNQDHAIYIFYTLEMPAESIKKLNDTLNITDDVIRFLITKPDLKAQEKAEALKAEKAKKVAERAASGEPIEESDSEDEER